MNIAVFGANYIGLPLAVLLAHKNDVTIIDSSIEKIAKINRKENPLNEKEIKAYLNSDSCNLKATLIKEAAYEDIDYAIIAIDTFYDPFRDSFNVSDIEKISKKILSVNNKCLIIITTAVPVGYTAFLKKKLETDRILYVPEFLNEEHSIKDYQYPQRLIIGGSESNNRQIGYMDKAVELFLSIAHNNNVFVLYRTTSEAESIKLFTNTYKAMRTSFFNFVEVHSNIKKIDPEKVIEGIHMDPIVGEGDPQPIRHGSYYFPTAIKNLDNDAYELIDPVTSILNNNAMSRDFIETKSENTESTVIGIYKIMLKDRYKRSLLNLISQFSTRGIKVVIFDPDIQEKMHRGCPVIKSCEAFKAECSLILAEKISEELKNVKQKVQIV